MPENIIHSRSNKSNFYNLLYLLNFDFYALLTRIYCGNALKFYYICLFCCK